MPDCPLAMDALGPTLCIGEILVEIVALTPGAGFSEPQPLHGPYPSGAPAIFIDQCARMGGKAAMVGAVGDDDFGRMTVARLASDGVETSAISVHPTLPTGTAFVRYSNDDTRDFVFNLWTSAAGALDWTPQVEELVARAGHLHVMGTLLAQERIWTLIERAAEIIRARGGSLSLDPNLRKELGANKDTARRFAEMVDRADLLLPSGDELFVAAGLLPERGEAAAVDALLERGVQEIALKRGEAGASVFTREGRIDAPSLQVDSIDPTGAGDCFGGAYVACRRLGLSREDALRYACAAGARNVTRRGPMEGAGTRADLDTLISRTMSQ